ncbi:MAG: hypothetical protein KUG74_06605 [Rhodobacteraceae bacterium]|nr:hypothetical protein [Paracoccaceae bacterium]
MDSQTKVMTVSYGTFSCTLEGFEDPFTTMQLVAEYFRKLAENDRYFGGDPLQPDAETLHQIARDANPNKVDAEVSDNSIILRQADVIDAPEPAPVEKTSAPKTFPEFASRRNEPAAPTKPKVAKAKPADDATLVEPTVFASRRSALQPGAEEPHKSAAEMLAEEEPATKKPDVQKAVEEIAAAMAEDIAAKPLAPEPKPAPVAKRATRLQEMHQDNDIKHEEEALERLLETTNSKLSTPSHARRSNALERLKAAVAATEAERRLRGGSKTIRPKVQDLSVDPDVFRKEMRSVRKAHEDNTKISRPVLSREAGSRRRSNIATLILGSDQQVAPAETSDVGLKKNTPDDRIEAPTQKQPTLEIVQPETPQNASSGFAGFAQKTGANTLQELLEASAAYLAIVEDQPRFSHERLVANVDGYLQDNSATPEATSRSLNRLLRDGRILRVKADRYCISKSTRNGYREKMAG